MPTALAWAIPLAAIIVSVASFVLSQRELGRRARVEYVDELEDRVAACETDRSELRRKVKELRDENLDLMRRVLNLERDAK